jgi:uncharacterized protein (TIGR01777 family)
LIAVKIGNSRLQKLNANFGCSYIVSVILIAGGSGLIGSELKQFLTRSGFEVRILTRGKTDTSKGLYHWNPAKNEIDTEAFKFLHTVINLAGANVLKGRWTKARKQLLRTSRINTTEFLVNSLKENKVPLEHYISASAMGFFGNRGDEVCYESTEKGSGFLADLCRDWEAAAMKISDYTKVSIARIGLYLSPNGGFYSTIAKLAQFYLASGLGSGKQYVNYTHYKEFNLLMLHLINQNYAPGIYHAVGVNALTLDELIQAVVKTKNSKIILPNVPSALLKIVLGEAATALTDSCRIESEKLPKLDFFMFQNANEALADFR